MLCPEPNSKSWPKSYPLLHPNFCLILRLSLRLSLNLNLNLSISLLPFECSLLSPHHQREGVQAITYWKNVIKLIFKNYKKFIVSLLCIVLVIFVHIQVRKIYRFKLLLNCLKEKKWPVFFWSGAAKQRLCSTLADRSSVSRPLIDKQLYNRIKSNNLPLLPPRGI